MKHTLLRVQQTILTVRVDASMQGRITCLGANWRDLRERQLSYGCTKAGFSQLEILLFLQTGVKIEAAH